MKISWHACLCLAALTAAQAEVTPPDPEVWYRHGYAPLWAERPGERIGEMLPYYADTVETHADDGSVSRSDKAAWLGEPVKQWLSEGWINSELQALVVSRLNATTATFKASWLDRYHGGAEELSCGWYLADLLDGRWQFTAYADIDCDDHGF
jgi:hypothetical protein